MGLSEKLNAVNVFKPRIGVWKMHPQIAQSRSAQQGITGGMDQHIRIRMTEQALFKRNGPPPRTNGLPLTSR